MYVSVHGSSATFANCEKVLVGVEDDKITDDIDHSYGMDNTNDVNWT